MTPPRLNGFNLIHKGLRLVLFETDIAIQQNDFSNVEQTQLLLKRLKEVLGAYEDHARHENSFILPAIAKNNTTIIDDFEQEHDQDHHLVETLYSHIHNWEIADNPESRMLAAQEIFYAFNEFAAFNLYHMNKEEKILNPEIWKHFSDDEIMGWSQQIIRSMPVEKLMAQTHWMFRAMNAPEALLMLKDISKMAPPEMVAQYMKIAEEEMAPDRWEFVKRNLEATA